MIPIKLNLSGFLSYRDPVEIDFTTFDLACISGANGSGKSSILDAITWSLFGQARKRDDSVINMQSTTAKVVFTFSYENNLYRVMRSKPENKTTQLEFQIQGADEKWKPLTERTMRATEARIEEILRLDYETFVNASFFLQGNADQFTQQRPSDRKRILSSILGLEIWETYRKATVERRKQIETQITELDGRLQEINIELSEEDQRKARLKEVQASLETVSANLDTQTKLLDELRQKATVYKERRQMVETLASQAERTRLELETQEKRQAERQQEKESFAELMAKEKEIEATYQALQAARAELAEWDQIAIRFNEHEISRHAPLTEIKSEETRLRTELEALKSQAERIAAGQAELNDKRAQLETYQTEVKAINKKIEARDALEQKRQQVLQEQAEAKAENPLLKAEMDELMGRIKQLETTDGAVCPLCGQPLSPEDRTRLIGELKEEGTQKGDKYRANKALLESVTEQVETLNQDMTAYHNTEAELREQTRLMDQTTDQISTLIESEKNWEAEGKSRLEEIEQTLEKSAYAEEARQQLAEIDKELKEIGYDAANHDTIRRKAAELEEAESDQRRLENAKATLSPLEREIGEIDAQVRKMQTELKKQEEAHQQAVAQLAVDQDSAPDIVSEERKMLTLQEQVNQIRTAVGMAQQNVQVLDTQRERKKELEAEREVLARSVVEHKVLERAFGKNGVPAMLIEQALPQIENTANEILERLSGGAMSVRFITQQEYKDSTRDDLRETLEIQISDSAGIRDYELYSGGEAFRINFAIRLALSEVLAQRAGARLQTLVIDEGFGSQDETGRQRLIEAINTVKADFAKILVITHIDALKDVFPTRLEVTKGPRGSVVEQI
ncbi:MAG TPA: SMC family ATPase [Anaerolineales bacterium]|nr:SMC family ATPase [Anaerolineales bacterium]